MEKASRASLPLVAVLSHVRSLHNVGSIFRSADGAGVQKIYCVGITPTPTDRFGHTRQQIAKVALGAEVCVPWEYVSLLGPLLRRLKKENFLICALEQDVQSIPYDDAQAIKKKLKGKKGIVLLVGGEVRGLSKSILKQVDCVLEIPMRGRMVRHAHHPRRTGRGKESLNVSVAFGVAAYALAHIKMR